MRPLDGPALRRHALLSTPRTSNRMNAIALGIDDADAGLLDATCDHRAG